MTIVYDYFGQFLNIGTFYPLISVLLLAPNNTCQSGSNLASGSLRLCDLWLTFHLSDLLSQKLVHSILRPPVKQEIMLVSHNLSHLQNTRPPALFIPNVLAAKTYL